jgi:DNA repair protein RadA/Sms
MFMWRCRACKGPPIPGNAREKPWVGPCPHCGRSRDADRVGTDQTKQTRSTFAAAAEKPKIEHVATGIEGLDYVLSGGLVPEDVILFGGFRSTGKTTLLVQTANSLSRRRKVVYASSEQSENSVLEFARRVGATSDNVVVLGNQRYIEDTIERVRQERPFFTIFDSLQKYMSRKSGGMPGSAVQGTAVASAIKDDCRAAKRSAIIVNQIARSGEFKGGTDVEHDVDAILVFAYPKDEDEEAPENDGRSIRVLYVDKNRNGQEDLKSYWCMTKAGVLERVPARSKLIELPTGRGRYTRRHAEQDENDQ